VACEKKLGYTPYAVRSVRQNGKSRRIYMHRAIMGAAKGQQVDHIDGDGLNNCRYNLRLATAAENQHNARRRIDNISGYKGVYWKMAQRKWCSQIQLNGKNQYIGLFICPIEAAHAYDRKAIELHGEFALLNFPND
jgi:hypothetical protein